MDSDSKIFVDTSGISAMCEIIFLKRCCLYKKSSFSEILRLAINATNIPRYSSADTFMPRPMEISFGALCLLAYLIKSFFPSNNPALYGPRNPFPPE